MEKLVSVIYGFLANILIYLAEFPYGTAPTGIGMSFGIAALLVFISIVLILFSIQNNSGRYDFPVKLIVGAMWTGCAAYYAVLQLSVSDSAEVGSSFSFVVAGLILAGAIMFAVVNFLLGFGKGKLTLMLWASEALFAASVLRLWIYIKGSGTAPAYEKVMWVSKSVDLFTSVFKKFGLQSITGVLEYIFLIVVMFITVYYLFRTKRFIPDEWLICVIAQIVVGIAYLLYEVHDGIVWEADQAFMVFLLFCTGWFVNIVIFVYEIASRNQDGCIGALFIGVSGVFWSIAVVLAADMAKRGSLDKSLERISDTMTKIYNSVPYGRHTDFSKGNVLLPVLGALLTIVLAVLIIVLLFLILGKVLNFDETGAGMGVRWFRNCSIVLIIPIVIYWICSMFGNLFGDNYPWISLIIQSLTGIGLALCISNIAPSLSKGFFGQLKLILISTLSALLASCLLIPAMLAMI